MTFKLLIARVNIAGSEVHDSHPLEKNKAMGIACATKTSISSITFDLNRDPLLKKTYMPFTFNSDVIAFILVA